MIDVRLTATNPEDSTLVPVPCNVRGELLTVAPVIESIPNDVEIQGDLTVTGLINGLSEGPPGPPGPEGPPGSIDLPPDPYEGSVLGWQDGQLAWIGGSVPLPKGVYGPFVYIAGNEQLNVPQDATGLVNGQQLFMSDSQGTPAAKTYTTDTIANVAQVVTPNYANVRNNNGDTGNVVGGNEFAALGSTGSASANNDGSRDISMNYNWSLINGGLVGTYRQGFQPQSNYQFRNFWYEINGGARTYFYEDDNHGGSGQTYYLEFTGTLTSLTVGGDKGGGNGWIASFTMKQPTLNGEPMIENMADTILTFPTSNNFDKFEVGDVVQDSYVITNIDEAGLSITTDGGNWGTDGGSGTPSNLETEWSGSGSVFVGLDQAIVLRANNERWVDDFYVTAPEQRVAARKLGLNAKRARHSATSKQ